MNESNDLIVLKTNNSDEANYISKDGTKLFLSSTGEWYFFHNHDKRFYLVDGRLSHFIDVPIRPLNRQVPESEIGHYYYDEDEGYYTDDPDYFLSYIDSGEVWEVKRRDYFDLPSEYAAKTWDDKNQTIGSWELFKSVDEAREAAAYCKSKCLENNDDDDGLPF